MVAANQTFNEALFDAMLRHQVGVLQFSGGVRNRVWALLDETEADLKRQIRKATRAGLDTPARVASLNALLKRTRETRRRGWSKVRESWFGEMRELAVREPDFVDRVFIASVPAVELGTVLPDPERLRQIVRSHPFEGRTMRQWARKLERDDLQRIESAIKIGLVQGEGPDAIARRIVGTRALRGRNGVTQATRRSAAAVVRTVTNGIASEARREYALANVDLAPQELFNATLDSRTTPICRGFDGKLFAVGKGPRLPLHFGERSLRSPVLDGQVIGDRPMRAFTARQLTREYANANGLNLPLPTGQTAAAARAVIPRWHKTAFDAFARRRMRELTGRVPAKTTYGQWLGRQSASFQDDVLGKFRGALFRRGDLPLDKFTDKFGRTFTLDELASRHSDAFLRAGLDLDLFAT